MLLAILLSVFRKTSFICIYLEQPTNKFTKEDAMKIICLSSMSSNRSSMAVKQPQKVHFRWAFGGVSWDVYISTPMFDS